MAGLRAWPDVIIGCAEKEYDRAKKKKKRFIRKSITARGYHKDKAQKGVG